MAKGVEEEFHEEKRKGWSSSLQVCENLCLINE